MAPTRRDALALLAAACTAPAAAAEPRMATRLIPGKTESIPVIGLGSSKAVSELGATGPSPLTEVLLTLVRHGGSVIDTWPRDAANDAAFGEIAQHPELKSSLFLTTKIDRTGREAGLAQVRESMRAYRRDTIDLAQIFSLTDLDTHWPMLKDLKAAGTARYIGVTVSQYQLFPQLEEFLKREQPDFVQMNYSVTERRAEERLLPLARDRSVAVLANRPFMNGAYFERLKARPLPDWVKELGCESWAQFSLKYILAHPTVTAVLTETGNPRHMAENARAGSGSSPDAATLKRMVAFIEEA